VGKRKIFFIFSLFQQVPNVFLMGFLLSFGGEGRGRGGEKEDFKNFPFVPTGSQCVPHGCSQSHLVLIPYVLLKVLPFSHISVGQKVEALHLSIESSIFFVEVNQIQ